jgi:hypothetical protein
MVFLLLAACSPATMPDALLPTPTPAVATPPLAAATAASPPPTAPKVDATLCTPNEGTYFSCVLPKGKIVSLCGSPGLDAGSGWVEYRFGRPGAVELAYPPTHDGARARFHYAVADDARTRTHEVGFQNDHVAYTLFDQAALEAGGRGDGVIVEAIGPDGTRKRVAMLTCDAAIPARVNLEPLAAVLSGPD